MLRVHSCKPENLSVDSLTYDILKLYSLLFTFTVMSCIKREGLEILKSGIIFHGNNKSYRIFPDTLQIFQ